MIIQVDQREIEVSRAHFREWFELEEIRKQLREAAERGDTATVSNFVCAYLSAASGEAEELFLNAVWYEVAVAYGKVAEMNLPQINFPIFENTVSTLHVEPWDYEERNWYEWVHLMASAYGWEIEYISGLEIEDGIGLLQEILVDNQLRREFEWGMSEMAWEYIPAAKKSRFRPMPRPYWMTPKAVEPKTIKIRKDLLPIGNVVVLDEKREAIMH